MKGLLIISASLLISTIYGCYYDVEEELYETIECQVDDMSYSIDISPILNENCFTCHSADIRLGNIILDAHSEVTKQVDNNNLLGAIKHSPGYSPMPQSAPMLLDCEIEKIEAWISQGALNN